MILSKRGYTKQTTLWKGWQTNYTPTSKYPVAYVPLEVAVCDEVERCK